MQRYNKNAKQGKKKAQLSNLMMTKPPSANVKQDSYS